MKKGKRKKEKGKRKVGLFGLELHQERHHKMGKYGKHHDKKNEGREGRKNKRKETWKGCSSIYFMGWNLYQLLQLREEKILIKNN